MHIQKCLILLSFIYWHGLLPFVFICDVFFCISIKSKWFSPHKLIDDAVYWVLWVACTWVSIDRCDNVNHKRFKSIYIFNMKSIKCTTHTKTKYTHMINCLRTKKNSKYWRLICVSRSIFGSTVNRRPMMSMFILKFSANFLKRFCSCQ